MQVHAHHEVDRVDVAAEQAGDHELGRPNNAAGVRWRLSAARLVADEAAQDGKAAFGTACGDGQGADVVPTPLADHVSVYGPFATHVRTIPYHRFAWLATFIGSPYRSMKPRAAVTS